MLTHSALRIWVELFYRNPITLLWFLTKHQELSGNCISYVTIASANQTFCFFNVSQICLFRCGYCIIYRCHCVILWWENWSFSIMLNTWQDECRSAAIDSNPMKKKKLRLRHSIFQPRSVADCVVCLPLQCSVLGYGMAVRCERRENKYCRIIHGSIW